MTSSFYMATDPSVLSLHRPKAANQDPTDEGLQAHIQWPCGFNRLVMYTHRHTTSPLIVWQYFKGQGIAISHCRQYREWCDQLRRNWIQHIRNHFINWIFYIWCCLDFCNVDAWSFYMVLELNVKAGSWAHPKWKSGAPRLPLRILWVLCSIGDGL